MPDSEPLEPKKPLKPDPNKPLFGDRQTGHPLSEPDPNYNPDQPYPDQSQTPNQEALFRTAAIKLAHMEQEIFDSFSLLKAIDLGILDENGHSSDSDYYISENVIDIRNHYALGKVNPEDLMREIFEIPPEYEFYWLSIRQPLPLELRNSASDEREESIDYIFTLNGKYGKLFQTSDKKFISTQQPTIEGYSASDEYDHIYSVPMQPSDFEVAGQALSGMKMKMTQLYKNYSEEKSAD